MSISAFDIRRVTLEKNNAEAEDLNYNFKAAKELGHLTTMTCLKRLNLAFNELSHVRGIHSLQQLQCVNLSHNALQNLDPITTLTSLTSLNAGCNKISSTSALEALPALKVLALHSNAIDKPSAVLLLSKLTSLQHLTLAHNPVCKQQDWQKATVGMLPGLQALDSLIITDAELLAAQPHTSDWHRAVEAGDLAYSTTEANNDSRGSRAAAGRNTAAVHMPGSQQSAHSEAGRLAVQHSREDSTSCSIQDAAALLPSISKPQLKPSSLTVRPGSQQQQQQQGQQVSSYGYSKTRPIKMLHQQRYEGIASSAPAVLVRSDGTAALQWPDGSMAATLDTEDPAAAATTASTSSAGGSGFSGGYRLLAMYRSVVGVAASFDSTGGFVQYPDGSLTLVWNKKDGVGTCYAPDGSITHSFNSRKRPLALKEDVSAQLDEHYSIVFTRTYELQLFFSCQGCTIGLSLQHGAMLPEGSAAPQAASAMGGGSDDSETAGVSTVMSVAAGAAAADADTQALLARARALMATDFGDLVGSSSAAAAVPPAAAAAAAAGTGSSAGAEPAEEDTQALLARARVLMASTHSNPV